MSDIEVMSDAVLHALAAHGPLERHQIGAYAGLSDANVARAIYHIRNTRPHYITVPTAPPYVYMIAPNVKAMEPGWLNQRQHDLTRAKSEVTRIEHGLRLGVSATEVMVLTAALPQAQAAVAALEAEIALLKML